MVEPSPEGPAATRILIPGVARTDVMFFIMFYQSSMADDDMDMEMDGGEKRPAEDEGQGGEAKKAKTSGAIVVSEATRTELTTYQVGTDARSAVGSPTIRSPCSMPCQTAGLTQSCVSAHLFLLQGKEKRTSSLQAPIMLLSGHKVSLVRSHCNGKGQPHPPGTRRRSRAECMHAYASRRPSTQPSSAQREMPSQRGRSTRTSVRVLDMIPVSHLCRFSRAFLLCGGGGAVLWEVQGECRNYNVLTGHKNAVLDLQWTHDGSKVGWLASSATG